MPLNPLRMTNLSPFPFPRICFIGCSTLYLVAAHRLLSEIQIPLLNQPLTKPYPPCRKRPSLHPP